MFGSGRDRTSGLAEKCRLMDLPISSSRGIFVGRDFLGRSLPVGQIAYSQNGPHWIRLALACAGDPPEYEDKSSNQIARFLAPGCRKFLSFYCRGTPGQCHRLETDMPTACFLAWFAAKSGNTR